MKNVYDIEGYFNIRVEARKKPIFKTPQLDYQSHQFLLRVRSLNELYNVIIDDGFSKLEDRYLMSSPPKYIIPIIADILNRFKYMDRRGSGFKKSQEIINFNLIIQKIKFLNSIQIIVHLFQC